MYKSREDEYQRRFDANDAQDSYGYDNNRTAYQNDVYDEDDFYGQIMKNASKNNSFRNIQPEPHQEYGNAYDSSFKETRRSRVDSTSHLPRMEEPTFAHPSYAEREEHPVNSYQKPVNAYSQPAFAKPDYPSQMEYKQPVRAYDKTSQFSSNQFQSNMDDYQNTSNFNTASLQETPSRRSRVLEDSYFSREPQMPLYTQEDSYPAREPQLNSYAQEESIRAPRRRSRSIDATQSTSYGGFSKELMEEPTRTTKPPMTLSEEVELQRKSKRVGTLNKEPRQTIKKQMRTRDLPNDYKAFVKQNLIIFVYAVVNCIALSIIASSVIYTQIIQNYVMPSGVQGEIIKLCLVIGPAFAYLVAGFHCGYFMFKSKLQNMKPVFKVLLSPIFFIVFEVVGFVCEIPYLIYAMVKMGNE